MIVELRSPFSVTTAKGSGRAIGYILDDAGVRVLVEHATGELSCRAPARS